MGDPPLGRAIVRLTREPRGLHRDTAFGTCAIAVHGEPSKRDRGHSFLEPWGIARTEALDAGPRRFPIRPSRVEAEYRLLRIPRREPFLEDKPHRRRDGASGEPVHWQELLPAPVDTELAVDARELLRALASLRWHQRAVLTLRLAGYSYKEIAERLGKTYTWVNRHLTEGRAELRRRWVRERGRPCPIPSRQRRVASVEREVAARCRGWLSFGNGARMFESSTTSTSRSRTPT